MKRIAILGNSIVGTKIIEEFRTSPESHQITLVTFEGQLPYDHRLLPDYVNKKIQLSQVLYQPKEFYEECHAQVIMGKEVERINFRRKQIMTAEKEAIPFDILIITDTPADKFPAIKGTTKTGVFSLRRLGDMAKVAESIPFLETVVVRIEGLRGLEMAISLQERGKEVFALCPEERLAASLLGEEASSMIKEALEGKGIKIITDNKIVEILGDSDVKAIKLRTGKVIACQAVIFAGLLPDFRMYHDTPLKINDRIAVDASFKTNLEYVYAAGDICEMEGRDGHAGRMFPPDELLEQGKVVAANLLGQEKNYVFPLMTDMVKIYDISVVVLGEACLQKGSPAFCQFNRDANTYKQLFVDKGILRGAVLINREDEKESVLQMIGQEIDLSQFHVEQNPLEAKREPELSNPPETGYRPDEPQGEGAENGGSHHGEFQQSKGL